MDGTYLLRREQERFSTLRVGRLRRCLLLLEPAEEEEVPVLYPV